MQPFSTFFSQLGIVSDKTGNHLIYKTVLIKALIFKAFFIDQ